MAVVAPTHSSVVAPIDILSLVSPDKPKNLQLLTKFNYGFIA